MNYIDILRTNVEKEVNEIDQVDYEAFMGFAQDAETDSAKENCIARFIQNLADEQSVSVEDVSFISVDANNLFDLFGEI